MAPLSHRREPKRGMPRCFAQCSWPPPPAPPSRSPAPPHPATRRRESAFISALVATWSRGRWARRARKRRAARLPADLDSVDVEFLLSRGCVTSDDGFRDSKGTAITLAAYRRDQERACPLADGSSDWRHETGPAQHEGPCRGSTGGLLVQRVRQAAAKLTTVLSEGRAGGPLLTAERATASKAFVRGLGLAPPAPHGPGNPRTAMELRRVPAGRSQS